MNNKTCLSIFKSNENLPYGFEISTPRYSIVKMNNRILFSIIGANGNVIGTVHISENMKIIDETGEFSYMELAQLLSNNIQRNGTDKEQFLECISHINSVFLDRANYVIFDEYYKDYVYHSKLLDSNPINTSAILVIKELNENLYHHMKEQIGIFHINKSLQT